MSQPTPQEERAMVDAPKVVKIGELRRKLFKPFDCAWNGYVRDVTAKHECEDENVSEAEVQQEIINKCAALINFKDFTNGDMSMQPHQERVAAEKRELDEKREKLGAFIEGAVYQTLPEDERNRLTQQASAMTAYSTILGERINAF